MNSAVRQVLYYLESASFINFSLFSNQAVANFSASSQPISKLTTTNPAKRTNMMATKMVTVGSGSLPFAYLSVLCVRPSLRNPAILLPRYPARPWPENRRSPGNWYNRSRSRARDRRTRYHSSRRLARLGTRSSPSRSRPRLENRARKSGVAGR